MINRCTTDQKNKDRNHTRSASITGAAGADGADGADADAVTIYRAYTKIKVSQDNFVQSAYLFTLCAERPKCIGVYIRNTILTSTNEHLFAVVAFNLA